MESFESSGQTLAESNEQFAYLTDMPIDGTGAAARRLGRRHSSESSNSRGRRRSSNGGGKGIRSSLSNTSLSSNASSQHSAATPTPPSESASHVPIPDINRPPVSPVLKPLAQKRHSQPRALPPISCSPTSSFTMREDV
uniref:Uncharacterized protein n=1 Tax=Tetraselmis chuii TaxID=63592 RepID=A0A7S1T1Z8_9CHLO|mmetsp:Transcript_37524/g.67211  ORF Transcript_37524/g.67211 Transcript_37524/m.67211 type:complete len:139 (+) Transcript_37524:1-417(+)